MRLLSGLLISTVALGTIVATGCAEHRYGGDPYYADGGYSGYYAANDPYYREWLAERQYNYVEYNLLSRDRQQEYWQWRRQNEARFRQDPRFRDNQVRGRDNQGYANHGRYANDHDRDDRRNNTYARTRNGDRDRHERDRERHEVRKDRDKDRDHDRDHDKDRDHDRR